MYSRSGVFHLTGKIAIWFKGKFGPAMTLDFGHRKRIRYCKLKSPNSCWLQPTSLLSNDESGCLRFYALLWAWKSSQIEQVERRMPGFCTQSTGQSVYRETLRPSRKITSLASSNEESPPDHSGSQEVYGSQRTWIRISPLSNIRKVGGKPSSYSC